MIIEPEGPGLRFLIIISILLGLSTIAIILRIWARFEIRGFDLDDWLMVLGYALLLFCCIADYFSISYGVGAHAYRLTDEQIERAKMWFLIAGIAYAAATAPVKASICVLILRVTPQRRYRWILYSVIVVSTLGSFIRVVTYLARCQPLQAAWSPSKGTCGSPAILTNVTYFFGTVCIITDWICAILPAFVIWKIQLSRKAKIYVGIMLALGVLASIATIVRMRFLLAYQDPDDYVYGITSIAIWSEVETSIGIVAGSLATMRPLLRYFGITGLSSNGRSRTTTSGFHPGYSLREIAGTTISRIAASYQCSIGRRHADRVMEEAIAADDAGSEKRILPIKPLEIVVESGFEISIESRSSRQELDSKRITIP